MRAYLSIALLCALLVGANARPQKSPADPRGIYIYSSDVATISADYAQVLTESLTVPGVNGIVLVIGWNAIEPSIGQFEWTTLDQWMSQAISAGLKVNLTIVAGSDTPSWLFQPAPDGAGAVPLAFSISPHSGATGVCDQETIAAPWDQAFLGQWDSMLAALAAHLKSMNAYDAVTLLRLTGINRTTDELRLPAETPESTGLPCVSNAISIWLQAQYRPSLLLQGWDSITTSFQKSFPDKLFSVAIIPQNPFPRIDENGMIIQGQVPDENLPLLMLASQKFPGKLVVQFNFLMPGEPASPAVVGYAQTLGTLAAFQTNNYFGSTGQGAACSEPVTDPTPCTDQTYIEMLQTGIYPLGQSNSLRAQYIEIFPANANAFPDDVQQAHLELDPDKLAVKSATQKKSGKLKVVATSTDQSATLSVTATPAAQGQQPIDLGAMTKIGSTNQFTLTRKGLPPISSVEITSTAGGSVTAQVNQP